MSSTDKYGSYGIVGFMIVNKKIEPSPINYLAGKYGREILFDFRKTKLNGPMKRVIDELNMTKVGEQSEVETYSHEYDETYPHIVTITDDSNA